MTAERVASCPASRAPIALGCTLRRRSGSPILVDTLDLGPDGMRITSRRPLAEDGLVNFDLASLGIAGRARALREQRRHVYALRFERLPGPISRCLHAVVLNAS